MSGENPSSNNEATSTVENETAATPATNEMRPNPGTENASTTAEGVKEVSKQTESTGNETSLTPVAAHNQDGPSTVNSTGVIEVVNQEEVVAAPDDGLTVQHINDVFPTPPVNEPSIEISTPIEVSSNAGILPDSNMGVTNQPGTESAVNTGIEILYPTSVDTRIENSGLLSNSSLSHVQVLVPRAVPGIEVTAVSKKECWICRTTEDEDPSSTWAQPCRCKGSTQWVHRECLRLWVDEKLKDNRRGKISCPQCKTPYLLQFPQPNILVKILEKIDVLIEKVSPTVAVVILGGSIYWCALTYGAVTMIQISDDSSDILENMDQSVLLTVLPAIPVGLIALEMYHWEDSLLAFLRRVSPHLPIFKHILPAPVTNESGSVTDNLITDGMNCTRVFTSGLLLPTIATIIGNIFFSKMNSGVQRAVVAGVTFIVVKGVLKMYHKQQIYKRKSKRKILDYTQENLERTAAASNTLGPTAALNIESYRLPPAI